MKAVDENKAKIQNIKFNKKSAKFVEKFYKNNK